MFPSYLSPPPPSSYLQYVWPLRTSGWMLRQHWDARHVRGHQAQMLSQSLGTSKREGTVKIAQNLCKPTRSIFLVGTYRIRYLKSIYCNNWCIVLVKFILHSKYSGLKIKMSKFTLFLCKFWVMYSKYIVKIYIKSWAFTMIQVVRSIKPINQRCCKNPNRKLFFFWPEEIKVYFWCNWTFYPSLETWVCCGREVHVIISLHTPRNRSIAYFKVVINKTLVLHRPCTKSPKWARNSSHN